MRNSDRLDVVRSLACVVALLAACSSLFVAAFLAATIVPLPSEAGLAALSARVKAAFDPSDILNRGRLARVSAG